MEGMRGKAMCLPVLLAVLLASTAGADPALHNDPASMEVWTEEGTMTSGRCTEILRDGGVSHEL